MLTKAKVIPSVFIIALLLLLSTQFISSGNISNNNNNNNILSKIPLKSVSSESSGNTISQRSILYNNQLTTLSEGFGEFTSSNYGYSIIGSGDLNSDGLDDIVIGAPYASPDNKINSGEVYIFYGAKDFALKEINAAVADVTISGNDLEGFFGWSICFPGDLNNDNTADILIGAPGTVGSVGKIYAYFSSTLKTSSIFSATSADFIIQGGTTGDKFGITITAINDVNNDLEKDILVGAPGNDLAYLMYGPTFGTSERTKIIGPSGTEFGTAVSGGTDLNNDGYLDYAISAPVGNSASNNKGQVFLYYGFNGIYDKNTISKFNNTLISTTSDNTFGQCLNSFTDINRDGFNDIIVTAPGEDSIFIYYGDTLTERFSYPYLWNMPGSPKQPVDFNSGVYNDLGSNYDINTYGLGKGDDGWDWGHNVFGQSSGANMDHIYGTREESTQPFADADGLDFYDSGKLEVIVGRSNTQLGPSWAPGWWNQNPIISDSGAWGIEFEITPAMFDNISGGADVILELDWEAHDAIKVFNTANGGTEERCYVKIRFSSSKSSTFLGTDLGGDATEELYYYESSTILSGPFTSIRNHFETNINHLIESSGNYYLEMGARLETTYDSGKSEDEGIVAFFDNVSLVIETLPISHSIKIKGISQSNFGHSFNLIDDLNGDGYQDLAIGAPNSDIGGINSGAVYIFFSNTQFRSQMSSSEAQRILTGGTDHENFGFRSAGAGDINGDEQNELLISAPGYANWLGKSYLYTTNQVPEILIIEPIGGITVEGNQKIVTRVYDYEDELEDFGVTFYYSKYDKGIDPDWILLTSNVTRNEIDNNALETEYFYSTNWNTKVVTDGYYLIKAVVMDNSYLSSYIESELFELDNPDPPIVNFIAPDREGQILNGVITIKVNCTDPDSDINTTKFYYSSDGEEWSYLGVEYFPKGTLYQFSWDTEEVMDDDYQIKVEANDTRGYRTEAFSVWFKVHNPGAPTINFVRPNANETLQGFTHIRISVEDNDDNIDNSGVSVFYSRDRKTWTKIDTITTVDIEKTYSTFWDTLKIDDGYYYLKGFVKDTTNLSAETILGPIKIDNPSPPKIQIEPLNSPIAGKVKIIVECSDDDSDLSSEGVTYYYGNNNDYWLELGKVFLIDSKDTGKSNIFEFTWDTLGTEIPDNSNYMIKVSIMDITGLTNISILDNIDINNPDPPTINLDNPKYDDKISGKIKLGAYSSDPDNDIDKRGVTYYFSQDGEKWYLIDNSESTVGNSTLFQLDWDTTELPNGEYHIRAEVTDLSSLHAEDTIEVQIDNQGEEDFLKVSLAYWILSLIWIIIIIILLFLISSIFLKRRRDRKKKEVEEERRILIRTIREELLRESIRQPAMISPVSSPTPLLPTTTQSPTIQSTTPTIPPVDRPILPPHQQNNISNESTQENTQPVSQPQPQVTSYQTIQPIENETTQNNTNLVKQTDEDTMKYGLTPDDMQTTDMNVNPQTQMKPKPPKKKYLESNIEGGGS